MDSLEPNQGAGLPSRQLTRGERKSYRLRGGREAGNDLANLLGQQRWNGVADLAVLLRPVPLEEVVVGKDLQAGGLARGQATALAGIRVDVVVPVLFDTGHHRRQRMLAHLHPVAVLEGNCFLFHVHMVREQPGRGVAQVGGVLLRRREA